MPTLRRRLAVLLLLPAALLPVRVTAPQGDAIVPVSVSTGGEIANGAAGSPSISADGRFVVFESDASNLQPGDLNGQTDVFLHDRQSGETRLISVSPAGVLGDGPSTHPVISGNGRIIVFESLATNLVEGDINGVGDIFVFDRLTGLIRRVSVDRNGAQADGESAAPDIDYAGRYLVYESEADNLALADPGGADAFIYDLVTGNVLRLAGARTPAISGDGRAVAYLDAEGTILLFHRVLGTTVTLSGSGAFPDLSHTGRNAAYLRDGEIRLLDREMGADRALPAANAPSALRLSADASAVVYSLEGSGLYLKREGAAPLAIWEGAVEAGFDLSADGGVVVFSASGLEPISAHSQIYVRELAPQPVSYHLAGRVTDARGFPLGLVTVSDGRGGETRTDLDGYFYLSGYPSGTLTLTPSKEGYEFDPSAWNLSVFRDVAGYLFTATPEEKLLEEARLDIGMPYDFNRGCDSPNEGCGKPFHGFAAGFCTDLILDAYGFGLDYDIGFALQQDAYAHPEHFYRWRDARDAHDMWRYFHFSGQMLPPETDTLPGDIVFFDWTGDGEIDHVALVSEVEGGRPVTLIDATGVTDQNPSGLAAELDWQPFHTATARGHARWNGTYEPVSSGFPTDARALQTALSGGGLFMRLLDSEGRAASFGEANLPRMHYFDLDWEEVVSQFDPAGAYTVEIRSITGAAQPYVLNIQTLSGGLVTGRQVIAGTAPPDEVVRIEFIVAVNSDGGLSLRTDGGGRVARPEGVLRKDR